MAEFQSFFMGGFECATHRRADGVQIDVLTATRHDTHAAEDYLLLQQAGVRTVRDGLRWHLIEQTPGVYDWSSFLPMLDASLATGTQVIWDLCHWGIPQHLDIFSPGFITSFAAFAMAAATIIRDTTGANGPYPFLLRLSTRSASGPGSAATSRPSTRTAPAKATRSSASSSPRRWPAWPPCAASTRAPRFVQAEPIINIEPEPGDIEEFPHIIDDTRRHTASQYQAWDMLRGDLDEDLGGAPDMLDIVGVNFYWNNQWIHGGDRLPPGHYLHRPLHVMLQDLWQRYRRPILITETGAESNAAVGWLGYIAAEVRQAQRDGVQMLGVCLYPVLDYPGWDDDRHCPCGLLAADSAWQTRTLRPDLVAELIDQARLIVPQGVSEAPKPVRAS